MKNSPENLHIYNECRQILNDHNYSQSLSTKLIRWLDHPNVAIADIAGRCIIKLGPEAFHDLLAHITAPGQSPWPRAIWVLSESCPASDQLLPFLRLWLKNAPPDLEQQCAISLAAALIARKKIGHPPDPADVAACLTMMEAAAPHNPVMRIQLKELLQALQIQSPVEPPPPTPEEEKILRIIIEDWQTRNSLQRAIAIAIIRGYNTPVSAAAYLHVDTETIFATLPTIWGLLYDSMDEKICIK